MIARVGLALLLGTALLGCRPRPEQSASKTPASLTVITGLPLFFAEGFTLDSPRHPVLARLDRHFSVVPTDGPEGLARGGLLLAAQPRAMTAARLVALDRWIRDGGRMLLLADPQLDWPSTLPLGDKMRPPRAFADTGLLTHWGLSLDPPGKTGPTEGRLGGQPVALSSPGNLLASPASPCTVDDAGLVAHCQIGRGRVTIVADSDWIAAKPSGPIDSLVGELKRLAAD